MIALVTGVMAGEKWHFDGPERGHPRAIADDEIGLADHGAGVAVDDGWTDDGAVLFVGPQERFRPFGFGEAMVFRKGDDASAGLADTGGVGVGDRLDGADGDAVDGGEALEIAVGGRERFDGGPDEDEFDFGGGGLAAEVGDGGADGGVADCGGGYRGHRVLDWRPGFLGAHGEVLGGFGEPAERAEAVIEGGGDGAFAANGAGQGAPLFGVALAEAGAVGGDAGLGAGARDFDFETVHVDQGEVGDANGAAGEFGGESGLLVIDEDGPGFGAEAADVGAGEEAKEVDDVGAEVEDGAAAEGTVAEPGAGAEAGGGGPADDDGLELTEVAASDAMAEADEIGMAALIEADGDDVVGGGRGDGFGGGECSGDRFFEEESMAGAKGGDGGFGMIGGRGGDDDDVAGGGGEQIAPIGEDMLGFEGLRGFPVRVAGGDDASDAALAQAAGVQCSRRPAAANYADAEGPGLILQASIFIPGAGAVSTAYS